MISCVKTDVGRVRFNNEDAFYFPSKESKLPALFIVAEGMGGHVGGEVASNIAVKEISSYVNSCMEKPSNSKRIKQILKDSFIKANSAILDEISKSGHLKGMGTTATVVLVHNHRLFIAHIGDSRAYRIRGEKIEQLTKDHSLVWELMEQGRITWEEASNHPMKNVITKVLGTSEEPEPDIHEFDLKNGDTIILCSDGLTNMIDDDFIRQIASKASPEEAVERLIREANSNGGLDNITVGIIKTD
ncbi:MAG: Stp1/IreP family PP2C-type Ser/Thr phosphatase [Thermoanaerobacterales bacterium]|nr:Stp1/IreP family PP2C-type Ser/Thr phosphatase [Thermoanaerobacterales bacterium]